MSRKIVDVRTYLVSGEGEGGDYHVQPKGHWIIDTTISNPMSAYAEYKDSRTSWGIGALGSILVEVEDEQGNIGVSTGFGGEPACYLIEKHFKRFIVGQETHNLNLMWDQMFRASMFYGRKGIPLAAISVVDLAVWDLLGIERQEPVWAMIGGKVRDEISFYCTGPRPEEAKKMGFWGGKVPLPYGPSDGHVGIRKNVEFLATHRETVGPDFPLMVDCYMSLTVPYIIELAKACEHININWWEEVLHPDDNDGYKLIKQAHPDKKFTTAEHEYSRYGFRQLITDRAVDIIQPDVMWLGGMTELLKVSAMAAAYDLAVVPHGSGPYSSHFVITQTHSHFCEYIANSPDGKSVMPVFGNLFIGEELPVDGKIGLSDKPGFGMTLNPEAALKRYISMDERG